MNASLASLLKVITEEEHQYLEGKSFDLSRYSDSGQLILTQEKLLDADELIQVRPHTRFVHVPTHQHDFVEMTYMISGTMTHIIEGRKLVLEAGDLIILNQNVHQEIMETGENDLAINFIIKPDFFDKSFEMVAEDNFMWEFLVSCLRYNHQDTKYLYFKTEGLLPVENLVENIIWMILNKEGHYKGIVQNTVGLLFNYLAKQPELIEFGSSSFDNEVGLKTYNYIDLHYQTASLQGLAEDMSCEAYWLSKEIKRVTGKNFKIILMERRLNQAAYYLKFTDLSTLDIMTHIGYANSSYYHRIFKERFKMTPKAYRQQHKQLQKRT